MADAVPLLVVVVAVAVASAALRRRTGVARPTHDRLDAAELAQLGAAVDRPTLLLFTAPGCAPCAPTRRMLDEAAGPVGIPVLGVDVASHPSLADAHRVLRAPTTFFVAPGGRIAARISGLPRTEDLAAATAALAGAPTAGSQENRVLGAKR